MTESEHQKLREALVDVRELRRKLIVSHQTDGRVSLDCCWHARTIYHPANTEFHEMFCLDCGLQCNVGLGELNPVSTQVSRELFEMSTKYVFANLGKKG